jgi:hypothetical protein
VASSRQQGLNTSGESIRITRISLNDVVKSGAGIFRVAAVRVSAVIKQPLNSNGIEVLAWHEQHRKPAHPESVDVRTVSDEEFHHGDTLRM